VPHLFKCTLCGRTETHASQFAAQQAGWRFVTALAKDLVKYWVTCPAEKLEWLDKALRDDRKRREEKA
jgi:hypothetical protein